MLRLVQFFTFYFLLCHYTKIVTCLANLENLDRDPDVTRNVSELISSKGYPVEDHTVQTNDGYLLSVQHMHQDAYNGVILLIHGLLGDAANFVLDFPKQSLGFMLFDAGYDVWLLNCRGCTYSKKHVTYTTNEYRFWNFSFEQMGQYDVPATIDYILEATGEEQLYIIAHSQGTTSTFAMLSEREEYNDKVKLFIALAPVATVTYMTSSIRILVPIKDELAFLVNILTSGEFLPNDKISQFLREEVCGVLVPELCEEVLFGIGGFDRAQLNQTRFPVYVTHFPSGTSTKSVIHYGQIVESKKFQKYDYGRCLNMVHYNQAEPPEYDTTRITTPVALFWSTNDRLADPDDVQILREKLNSIVVDHKISYPYNHFDFILAKNAPEYLYNPIIQLISEYTQQ